MHAYPRASMRIQCASMRDHARPSASMHDHARPCATLASARQPLYACICMSLHVFASLTLIYPDLSSHFYILSYTSYTFHLRPPASGPDDLAFGPCRCHGASLTVQVHAHHVLRSAQIAPAPDQLLQVWDLEGGHRARHTNKAHEGREWEGKRRG